MVAQPGKVAIIASIFHSGRTPRQSSEIKKNKVWKIDQYEEMKKR
jgi:hypothetical protein